MVLLIALLISSSAWGHAKVEWHDGYPVYLECPKDQYAVSIWRGSFRNSEDFLDALEEGEATFWLADQRWNESVQVAPHNYVVKGSGTVVVRWLAYSFDNKLNYRWAGVLFGDPHTDVISPTRFECRTFGPSPRFVPVLTGNKVPIPGRDH
jgi:hypothetical protein